MFRRFKTPREDYLEHHQKTEVKISPVATVSVMDMVIQNAVNKPQFEILSEHELRLAKYNTVLAAKCSRNANTQKEYDLMKTLEEVGFRIFVKSDIVNKFPYYAGINEHILVRSSTSFERKAAKYLGDIPEFALDRIDTFIGMFSVPDVKNEGRPLVSIHSMNPLPVQELDLSKIDPVVIGWPTHMVYRNNYSGTSFGAYNSIGVVLAIWDNDKELEL